MPFLYSNEIWGNELKEIGASWAVFINFMGKQVTLTMLKIC